jgi:hypothetical protein
LASASHRSEGDRMTDPVPVRFGLAWRRVIGGPQITEHCGQVVNDAERYGSGEQSARLWQQRNAAALAAQKILAFAVADILQRG